MGEIDQLKIDAILKEYYTRLDHPTDFVYKSLSNMILLYSGSVFLLGLFCLLFSARLQAIFLFFFSEFLSIAGYYILFLTWIQRNRIDENRWPWNDPIYFKSEEFSITAISESFSFIDLDGAILRYKWLLQKSIIYTGILTAMLGYVLSILPVQDIIKKSLSSESISHAFMVALIKPGLIILLIFIAAVVFPQGNIMHYYRMTYLLERARSNAKVSLQ